MSFKPNFTAKIPQTPGFLPSAPVFNNLNQKPKPVFQSFAGTNPQNTGPGQGFGNFNQNQIKSANFSGAPQPRQGFPNNPVVNKANWPPSIDNSVVNKPAWTSSFGNSSQFTNESMSNQGSFQPNFNKRTRNFDERASEAQGGNFNQAPRPTRDFPNKTFQGPNLGNPNSRPTMEIDHRTPQSSFGRPQFPTGPKRDFNKNNFTGPGKGNTMEVDPRNNQTSFNKPPGNRRAPEFINQEKGFQAENQESPRKNKFNTLEDPRKNMFNNNQEEPKKRHFNNQERQFSGNFRENKPETNQGNQSFQSFQPQRGNREKPFNPGFEMQNPRFQKTQKGQNSQSEKTFRVEGSYSGRVSKDDDPYDEEPDFDEEQAKISARNDRFNSGRPVRNEESHSGKFVKNEENTQRFNKGNRDDQEQFRKKKTFQARDQTEDQEDEENTEDLDKLEEQYRKRALASLHRSKSLNKSPATIKIPPRVFPETKRPQFEAKFPQPEKKPPPQYKEKAKILETGGLTPGHISMCSAEECRSREESMQLSIFERKNSEKYECNPQWALKKYLRSSADRQEDKRSAESLTYALDHLINNIIDLDTNNNPLNFLLPEDSISHKFTTIYPFVFDRMRAIAKDWKILQVLSSPDLIRDHEIMARFLILSCVEGFYSADFNQNLNQKLVEDLLNCLIRAYEYNREKAIDCENESEFTAYFILAKPENLLQIFTLIKSLPEKVLVHPYMRIAINLFKNYHNDDFAGFFATVKNAPYLIACAAYPIFHKFRAISLEKMHFSTFKSLPIEDFVELLYFSNTEEARDYAEFFDLEVETNMVNSNKDVVKVGDISDKLAKVFPCVPKNIQMKKAQKKRKDIVLGVDNDFKYGNEEIEEVGLDWGIKEQKLPKENKEKSDGKKEEDDKKNDAAKEPKFELKTQLWAESFKDLLEKKHEDKKPVFEDKKDFFPPLFQEPISKPIKIDQTDTKPLFKTSEISDFSIENLIKPVQTNHLIAQSPEKKEPEKKISFRFPSDDKTIFSILKDKHLKEKIKENTRNYRIKKKTNTKLQLKKCRVFQESRIFLKWKELTKYNKLQNYIYERRKRELQAYENQFSNEIISDSLNYSRFSANKRQKTDEQLYPVIAEEAFVQKFISKNVLSYKLQISSPSQHELFKYTQQKLKGVVGVLAEKNVVIDFSNRSEMACDFVVFIGKSFELHQLRCPFSQNLVAIITDHVNSEDQIKDKLKVYTENEPRIVVLPMIFSVNEFAFYDLVIYPIIEALNKYNPVYGELKVQSLADIFGVYKKKIEESEMETQKKLFSLDFNGTFNYWVEFLNSITAGIEKKVKRIYAVPPTTEALKRWEIDNYDYTKSLKVYEALIFVLKEFYFESLPEINPKDVWNMDMNKIVYAYAGRLASRFEKIFGNSFDLLLKLDETFCKFPINVNSKLLYIKGPWFEYFTNILAFFLSLIGKLERNVVWELEEADDSVYKTKEFLVDIKEIHEETEARNKSVDFWGSRGFNDRVGEDVFVRELAMHI